MLANLDMELVVVNVCSSKVYSLYSTHLRSGIALGTAPKARGSSCWYPKSLTDPTATPQSTQHGPLSARRDPQCEQVEYGRIGSLYTGAHVGHVAFMLFVSISFVLGSERKLGFWWNMGLWYFV